MTFPAPSFDAVTVSKGTGSVTVELSAVTFPAFEAPAVTVAIVPAPTVLTLAEWDDTGLDVEFSALIEVSGTSDLYADADRGGTDTPLDGELGIGDDETRVSRIRWISSSGRLVFNDNDNPAALAINTYFATGGAGNDLTFYVTDLSGTYTFNIADNLQFSNASTLRFENLPAALVHNLRRHHSWRPADILHGASSRDGG